MPLEMRQVFSDWVSEIGYDPETQELHVGYKRGKRRSAVYRGVPEDVAARVMSSPSIGEALHAEVRGQFEHG
jgi:hypothetical protein